MPEHIGMRHWKSSPGEFFIEVRNFYGLPGQLGRTI
jgi:hypothetical protein